MPERRSWATEPAVEAASLLLLLAAIALVVAISDLETGHRVTQRHWLLIVACLASPRSCS